MSAGVVTGPLLDAGVRVLTLLARLPLIWTEALATLAGTAGRTATFERVAALRRAGLVGAADLPVRPGRTPLLLYLTAAGVAALAAARGEDTGGLARRAGLGAPGLRGMVPGLPHRLACYELLVGLAGTRTGPPELVAWECPWRRAVRPSGFARTGIVRLPAGAALRWPDAHGAYLLLPDPGTVPLRAYREALVGLVRRRQAGCATPPLVIACPDRGRADGWWALLEQVSEDTRDRPPAAVIWTRDELPHPRHGGDRRRARPGGPVQLGLPAPGPAERIVGDPFRVTGRPLHAADRLGRLALQLGPCDRRLLEHVGPHPFLPVRHLATVLGWTVKWTRERRDPLIRLGLVRLLGPRPTAGRRSLELAELTRDGAAIVAAQLGLTPGEAARFLGLVAHAPTRSPRRRGRRLGTRDQLLQHLRHTVAVDAVFAHLREVARRRGAAGGDDALLDWRNAAACARGHLRPDGYGLYRQGGELYGFLLEYDGGTEGPARLRRKFERYYRYGDSQGCERDFQLLPTILVVARDYGAEQRIVGVLRRLAVGRAALPVLLTTRDRVARDPDGALGRVWREPSWPARRHWLLRPSARTTPERIA